MSMAEEFQESEILFRERFEVEGADNVDDGDFRANSGRETRRPVAGNKGKSASINIPEVNNASRNARFCWDFSGGCDGEFVPPHVIIGRRVAGKVLASSLCTGYGRSLKGRDLREFRNLILKMTGFLET